MKERQIIKTSVSSDGPIDCDQHDYIEIACMHHYELLITLKDGREIKAKAVTTETRGKDKGGKEEYFIAETDNTIFEIPMAELSTIETLSSAASFGSVRFD